MKKTLPLFAFLSLVLVQQSLHGQSQKIEVLRDQVMVLTPQEETFMKLFDGDGTTTWFPGWGAMYPAKTLIDLKGIYTIKQIRIKNYTGTRTFKIYGGSDPFTLTPLVDQLFSNYNQWYDLTFDVSNVAYLQLELPELKKESPAELEIYGIKTAESPEQPGTGVFRSPLNVNGTLGVNGFHWVDPALETPFMVVREYLDVEWIQHEDGKYRYNPSWSGAGMFDDHYAQMKSMGIEVLPCLQGNLPWTRTAEYNDKDFKPVYPVTADPMQPASYAKQAAFHFQFAARYGSTVVDESLVLVDPTPRWNMDPPNVKRSGLGYIKYFECWNEPDKDWEGINGYMNPFEFAAYISAVADGHCKTLGTTVGIKNADPTAKVVMGGLANMSLDYIKAMVLWFRKFRPDHSVPVDVFNVHHYSNSAGFQHVAGSVGISPEQDQLRTKLQKVKEYIDRNLPGKEVFLSEFGYDSNTGSVQRCEPIGSMSRDEVQGIWNVRTVLEVMASQIDRSYVYLIYDEADTEQTSAVFGNCGMVTSGSTGSVKKPAWYYMNTLKTVLKDCKFTADQSPDNLLRKYRFQKGDSSIYVLWLSSVTDASSSYTLSISSAHTAEIIQLENNNANGKKSIQVINGSLTLDVSERPTFVIVDQSSVLSNRPPEPSSEYSISVAPNPVYESVSLNFSSSLTNIRLEILNSSGQVAEQKEFPGSCSSVSIPASHWTSGIYLIKITDGSGRSEAIKVMKE